MAGLEPLTERQHAAVERWWRDAWEKDKGKALVREFLACGFETAYSCISWAQLRVLLPGMAEVLGRNIIARHRLRV